MCVCVLCVRARSSEAHKEMLQVLQRTIHICETRHLELKRPMNVEVRKARGLKVVGDSAVDSSGKRTFAEEACLPSPTSQFVAAQSTIRGGKRIDVFWGS